MLERRLFGSIQCVLSEDKTGEFVRFCDVIYKQVLGWICLHMFQTECKDLDTFVFFNTSFVCLLKAVIINMFYSNNVLNNNV